MCESHVDEEDGFVSVGPWEAILRSWWTEQAKDFGLSVMIVTGGLQSEVLHLSELAEGDVLMIIGGVSEPSVTGGAFRALGHVELEVPLVELVLVGIPAGDEV